MYVYVYMYIWIYIYIIYKYTYCPSGDGGAPDSAGPVQELLALRLVCVANAREAEPARDEPQSKLLQQGEV